MDETKRLSSFGKYIHAQMRYIETAKYFEGIKVHYDPGDAYIIEWINRNAKEFRIMWDCSCCKDCCEWKKCGDKVKKNCEDFKNDNE